MKLIQPIASIRSSPLITKIYTQSLQLLYMNNLCIRHKQEVISFCSNSLCNDFLKMYCAQCDTSNCIDYHMKVIEEQRSFIESIKLPDLDFKLWDNAKMQFNTLKQSIGSLQQQILQQLDDSHTAILNYISEKITQMRQEILMQFSNQLDNCGIEFTEMYDSNIKQLQEMVSFAKSTLNNFESTETDFSKVNFKLITQLEQKSLAYEGELYTILEDNSKQINQINGQLEILQQNSFEKSSSIVFGHLDSALSVILCKFYQLSGDSRTTSLAESEILNKMVRRSRSSIMSSQLGQSMIEDVITDCSVQQIQYKQCEYSRSIVPLCLVSIRDSNQVLTAGESSDVFLWEFKQYWEVQCTLTIKDVTCIQAMELVYNPIDNRTSTRASFATLRVLLNPVIALAGNQGVYLIQADSVRNELLLLARYPTKETTICLQSLQPLGYYNYFMAASDTGVISIYQYIISIEEQFTLRLDQVVKCHQDAITSLDIFDQYVVIASSDRSVSIWQFSGIKMKLFNRLNRFWEDIPCIRTSGNTFITFDRAFNIVQWEIQDQQVRVLNQCQSKAKLELHEVIVFNECFVSLAKDNKDCYIIVLDKQFKVLNSLKTQLQSILHNPKKKKQFYTNHKMRITQQYEFAVINTQKTTMHFSSFKLNL